MARPRFSVRPVEWRARVVSPFRLAFRKPHGVSDEEVTRAMLNRSGLAPRRAGGSADLRPEDTVPGVVRYLTDGTHLYEVAAQRTVQNYGLMRGVVRYTILRDVVTEVEARLDELQLACLSEVRA
jgi:hypothetical protein